MITPDIANFIELEMTRLKAYNALRPSGHHYAFHLHSQRVAKHMYKLALAMGMPEEKAVTLQLITQVHDIGKRLLPVEIWDVDGKPDEKTRKIRRGHTQLGVDIVNEHFGADNNAPALVLMRELMANHHEALNGSGWLGLRDAQLSLEARMLCVCDAFDGYSVWRPHYGRRDIRPAAVLQRMAVEKKGQFDTEILAHFAKLFDVTLT